MSSLVTVGLLNLGHNAPGREKAADSKPKYQQAEVGGSIMLSHHDDGAKTWARVELMPDLPMAHYTAQETWHAERIGALTMYCCDGRWGEAFDEFCHRSLLIPRYDRFAVPGGPAWLVRPEPSLAGVQYLAREQLGFLVRAHDLERIVLITHFGCAFYHDLLGLDAYASLPIQVADVRLAMERVAQWFPGVTVEGFLAMREGNRLTFRPIEP